MPAATLRPTRVPARDHARPPTSWSLDPPWFGRRRAEDQPTRRRRRGRRHDEAAAGGWRPLRAPDPTLEPEDAPIHLRGTQRHLHHRPATDPGPHRHRLPVRAQDRRGRRCRPLRGHQEAGPGAHPVPSRAVRDAVRELPLARRHAHELPDRALAGLEAPRARPDGQHWRDRADDQEGRPQGDARSATSCSATWGALPASSGSRTRSSSSTRRRSTSRSPRRTGSGSPSSRSSTPTATRTSSTTSSPATTTRSAPRTS